MKRDLYIDFLRFIGLSFIILVHVNPPVNVAQVRCFDVPLMLFVSGLTASSSRHYRYVDYVTNRTKRLIIPVWMFLAAYLPILYFVQFKFLPEQYLTGEMIVRSFLLLDNSIGYVWIIRIFLIVMLATPFILKLNNRIENIRLFVFVIVTTVFVLEGIHLIGVQCDKESVASFVVVDIIQYGIAYSIPFMLGVRCRNAEKKEQHKLLAFVIVVFTVSLVYYVFSYGLPIRITPNFKTPPHSYYIVYGCFVSVVLWQMKTKISKWLTNKYFILLGQNTIWIYLWHMPLALVSNRISDSWTIRYIFVYGCAIFIFMIQRSFVNKINSDFARKYLLG